MKEFKGTKETLTAYPDALLHNHKFCAHPFACDILVDGKKFEERMIARVFGDTKDEAMANARLFAHSLEFAKKLEQLKNYRYMSDMEKLEFEQEVQELLDNAL